MRIIGLRHGQSQYNLRGLCNDDDARRVELTERGLSQAKSAAERLRGVPVERVFVSPLLRARLTANVIAGALGLATEIDQRLADIRSGFDGRPVADYLAAIAADPIDTRVAGGESLRDHQQRVEGFLRWLEAQPFACVLVVAHEETLRVLDAHARGADLAAVIGKTFANAVPYFFQSSSGN